MVQETTEGVAVERKMPTPLSVGDEYLSAILDELRAIRVLLSARAPASSGEPATESDTDTLVIDLREPAAPEPEQPKQARRRGRQ